MNPSPQPPAPSPQLTALEVALAAPSITAPGLPNESRYIRVPFRRVQQYAHRRVWELAHGRPITPSLVIDHLHHSFDLTCPDGCLSCVRTRIRLHRASPLQVNPSHTMTVHDLGLDWPGNLLRLGKLSRFAACS